MSPARPTLTASSRTITGKHVSRLRRDGQLPGVLFGRGVASTNVVLDAHDFDLIRRRSGPNTLFDLEVDGGQPTPTLIHGVQVHPVTRRPLHVDLLAVVMTQEITVEVPVVTVGQPPAAVSGGTLTHLLNRVRVRALPDHLPQQVEVSVEGLETFEDAVYVRDLRVPEGVQLLSDPAEIVARVLPPRIEAEPAPAEEALGEEALGEEGPVGEAVEGSEESTEA